MRIWTAQDFQNVITALSGSVDPSNPGMQALLAMLNDSRVQLQPYSFVLTFTNVAAGVTPSPQSFIVDTSAPFMLITQEYLATANPVVAQTMATANVPNMGVAINDQQSNRNWQSGAVPVSSIFGTGERPYFLPQPRMIAPNSNVQVTVNNFDSAQAYNLYLTFTGYRYYDAS